MLLQCCHRWIYLKQSHLAFCLCLKIRAFFGFRFEKCWVEIHSLEHWWNIRTKMVENIHQSKKDFLRTIDWDLMAVPKGFYNSIKEGTSFYHLWKWLRFLSCRASSEPSFQVMPKRWAAFGTTALLDLFNLGFFLVKLTGTQTLLALGVNVFNEAHQQKCHPFTLDVAELLHILD